MCCCDLNHAQRQTDGQHCGNISSQPCTTLPISNISDFQDLIPPSRKLGTERAPTLEEDKERALGSEKKKKKARNKKETHML